MADPGHELGAASVTIDLALHEKAWGLAVGETEEGQEAEGRGKN